MPQLYLDMDGVLADFAAHHEAVFGFKPCKKADNVDWEAVRRQEGFYADIPPMVDMPVLWRFTKALKPIILTGVPRNVPEATANKTAWVRKHLGPNVPVMCVPAREKSLWCKPGDILVDDWEKHRLRWLTAGGIWITHVSAAHSIAQLEAVLVGAR
jgi:hypothetical protein